MQTRVSLKYFLNDCRYNWSCNYFIVFFLLNIHTQKLQKLAADTNYSKSVNDNYDFSKANAIYKQSTYSNGDIGEIQDLILDKVCLSKNLLWLM